MNVIVSPDNPRVGWVVIDDNLHGRPMGAVICLAASLASAGAHHYIVRPEPLLPTVPSDIIAHYKD